MGAIQDFIVNVLNAMLSFLPDSPFATYLDNTVVNKYLGYVNWFIPVADMIAIGQAWLIAIAVFYIYQALLRWVKAIE